MKLTKIIILVIAGMFSFGLNADAQVKKTPVKKAPVKKVQPKKPVKTVKQIVPKDTSIRVKLTTDSGVIVMKLYDRTPLHRDNFVKLVKEKYFDSLLFHRVIANFMIQGGDPDSKNAAPGGLLGNGGPGYRVTAEFDTTLFHKRGALAAAREGDAVNPLKESSGSQFYIVHGKKWSDMEISNIEARTGRKISAAQKEAYKTVGGTPFLDQNYTVFGETESGFDVIDKIANLPKDGNNRPLKDIRMKIEIVTNK